MMQTKKRLLLTSEMILEYLIGKNDKLDTLIMCKSSEVSMITTDFNLYEALGAIKDKDSFRLNKLVKLLEGVKVVSFENVKKMKKPVLTDKRMLKLREVYDARKKD